MSILLSVILLSCKKDESKEVKRSEVTNTNENTFKVSLDLLLKKNDTIHLYYTEDGSINFNEENSVWLPVQGKDVSQHVTFILPKDVFPTEFRFDFGVNPKQDDVILNKVRFDFVDKSFEVKDSTIFNYFRIDENVTVMNSETKALRRKDSKQKNGPSLYPHEVPLKAAIGKLTLN